MREETASSDVLGFIRRCVGEGRVLWTYHVNMRMLRRRMSRNTILAAVDPFEIIEEYPEDRYLPSYLVLGRHESSSFHVLIAVDEFGNNVRVITAYEPEADEWGPDLRTRRR